MQRAGKGAEREREMGEAPPMAKPRREFPAFPFEPYPIQVDFMAALYESVDKGGVAMLESPTGEAVASSPSYAARSLFSTR